MSHANAEAIPRLSRDDWAQAALTVIGERGLAAVAVEPLAAGLGVTKGSFYWHFDNRAALVDAALECWERDHTAAVIEAVAGAPGPAERLRILLRLVVSASRVEHIEVALLASTDEPAVAAAMARVTERRIEYVASQYEAMGSTPAEARRQAVLAVSVYVGHVYLSRAAFGSLPRGKRAWNAHLDNLIEALIPAT